MVIIGDSTLWGVAEPYAQLIEQDRGVKVTLHDEWQGGLSAGTILKALRGDFEHSAKRERWPQLIRDAEVLVLFGNPTDSLAPEMTETAWHCVEFTDPGQVEIPADAFVGQDSDGLPFGVQLLGKRWADERLLAIAEVISEIAGGFQRPPGY